MGLLKIGTVQKVILGLPDSEKLDAFSNYTNTVFSVKNIIIVIPTQGISIDHLTRILENQLEMSWWMIDYVYGQNGIK